MITPRRGEVYLVHLDPTVGSEIGKTRPAVVIQNDVGNRHSPITIVAAITSRFDDKLYPTEVLIRANEGGLKQESVVLLNQVRSVARQRMVKKLGKLSETTMKRTDKAILISLGLIDV